MPQVIKIHPSQKRHLIFYLTTPVFILVLLIFPFFLWEYKAWVMPLSYTFAIFLFFTIIYQFAYTEKYNIVIRETGVEFSYGVFTRKTESVEMYRIMDFTETQTFTEMILKIATISIHSSDYTTPVIKFLGIEAEDARRFLRFLQENASDSLVKHLSKAENEGEITATMMKSRQSQVGRREP